MLSQNLCGACAENGVRVLAIDLDPQASLSKNFFGRDYISRLRPHQTVAGLYDESRDPEPSELIHATAIEKILVAPSSDYLEPYDLPSPMEQGDAQFAVRDFVEDQRDEYDIILTDTPPNVANLLAWGALMASDYVITPVQPEKNSCEGVVDVKVRLQTAIRNGNPSLVDLGYFFNNMDTRTSQHRLMEDELRQLNGSQVFETVIYRRTEFQSSQHSYQPITQEKPSSAESDMIRALLVEIIERIEAYSSKEKRRAVG